MQPHIRRWHTRYRIVGERGNGVALLERGVRQRVAEPYAEALEHAFAGDPAVYVLRRVHTQFTVTSPSLAAEAAIARRWAEQICTGVVRAVTRQADQADLVMRFADTADYVVRFLSDLLDGVAWERWYYGAFSKYRGLDPQEAVSRILIDFREELPIILHRLAGLGRLRATISRVSDETVSAVWRTAVRRFPEGASAEQFRVFLRAALAIADTLELWVVARPAEHDLLEEYFRTAPPPPDWKQTRALAQSVYAILAFLEGTGMLAPNAPGILLRFEQGRDQLLAGLEWLDREWLGDTLHARFAQRTLSPESLSVPRQPALSSLQRRILELLCRLLHTGAIELPGVDAQAAANSLALFAALSAAEPDLASHPGTPAAIEWLLRRWSGVATLSPSTSAGSPLRLASLIESILNSQNSTAQSSLAPTPSQAAPPVAPRVSAPTRLLTGDPLDSSCAGLFLLSRAVLEARATQLAAAVGLPAPGLLLALAAEWSASEPDALDQGALLWCGYDHDAGAPSAQIAALDAARCEALCTAIERILRDRSAFAPSLAPERAADSTPLSAIAVHLLRLWAYWLPGVARSSAPWLLQQLIRRRGVLRADGHQIAVSLRPASLDVVLEMAGYFQPIPAVPWLADRRITFTIDRAIS